MNNQRPHVVIILGLAMVFYLASALSSMLFARHWMATDCLNPVALDYFRSLMLVSLAMLDPHASPTTPLRVSIPEQTESQ
jgi:hypothetical protein